MSLLMIITFLSITLISWQVAFLRLSRPLRFLIGLLLYCGIAYLPLGIAYKFGSMIPYWAVIIFSLLTATSIIFISLGVLRLSLLTITTPFAVFSKNGRRIFKKIYSSSKLGFTSLIIAFVFGCVSLYGAAKIPAVKYYDLVYNNLPQELDGYKIAHISDTHVGVLFRKTWNEELVEKIMAEKTDLIVHTGDIADGLPSQVKDSITPMLDLSAPDGVYHVMGNHENYHSISAWREYYKSNQLNILEDEYVVHKSLPLVIAGAAAGPRTKSTDYEKLLKNIPDNAFILLLDHYPNRASKSKDYVDLQLSGHTHGGLTFYLAPIIAKFNEGFVNGLYNLGNMKLFVTSCAGLWSYAPLRLFVPSEIAILRLVKG